MPVFGRDGLGKVHVEEGGALPAEALALEVETAEAADVLGVEGI